MGCSFYYVEKLLFLLFLGGGSYQKTHRNNLSLQTLASAIRTQQTGRQFYNYQHPCVNACKHKKTG